MGINVITSTIVIAIIGLFYYSFINPHKRVFKTEIISLGVFGTFLGITIGLFGFDVNDIKNSVPILIDGLKTSFVTSAFGIFFSILLSILKPQRVNTQKEILVDTLESIVKNFNENLTTQFGDNFKELNKAVNSMIIWQENYKNQIDSTEKSIKNVLDELKKISLQKDQEQKNIQMMINNLKKSSDEVRDSLKESTEIVKENLQLLLRDANGKL